MKSFTKISHNIVRKFSFENGVINLSQQFDIFRKLLPLPSEYHDSDFVRVVRNGINFGLNRSDYMQWRVFADFDEPVYNVLSRYLNGSGLIIDVGANIGAFSLNIAKKGVEKGNSELKILAFEPNPDIAAAFKKNLELNPGLSTIIEINQSACGDENGESNLVFNSSNSGGGKIGDSAGVPVRMIRLDDFLSEERRGQVKILKIDVEGYEPQVLNGAIQVLKKSHPLLYLEVTDSWYRNNGSSARQVINSIRKMDYDLFYEEDSSFKILENIPDEFQFNLLGIPK